MYQYESSTTKLTSSFKRYHQWRLDLGLLPTNDSVNHEELMKDQRDRYFKLVEKYPFPDKDSDTSDDGKNIKANGSDGVNWKSDLDPLTALVLEEQSEQSRLQEMDIDYRKQRALRKRGLLQHQERVIESEEYDVRIVTLQMLEKDLHRLPATGGDAKWRRSVLTQVLYIFANHHSQAGYLQGMHEIASHVLEAVELDYKTDCISKAVKQEKSNGDHNSHNHSDPDSDHDHERLEDVPLEYIQSKDYKENDGEIDTDNSLFRLLCADTYILTEHIILAGLQGAYDLDITGGHTNETFPSLKLKPLVAMSQRVLNLISQQDSHLARLLSQNSTSNAIPMPLILTKWMRVFYSREIVTDKDNQAVLKMWDILFRTVRESCGVQSLQSIAECMAAARVILHSKSIQYFFHNSTPTDLLHWFMNIPPENEQNIHLWIEVMQAIVNQTPLVPHLQQALPLPDREIIQFQQRYSHEIQTTRYPKHQFNNEQENPRHSFAKGFSSITDKLVNQTQTIQKRIQQEWDTFQLQQKQLLQQQDEERKRISIQEKQQQGNSYNLDYHRPLFPDQQDLCSSGYNSGISQQEKEAQAKFGGSNRKDRSQKLDWAERLERQVGVLQSFVATIDQTVKLRQIDGISPVPKAVWETLADLEVLSEEIFSSSKQDSASSKTS